MIQADKMPESKYSVMKRNLSVLLLTTILFISQAIAQQGSGHFGSDASGTKKTTSRSSGKKPEKAPRKKSPEQLCAEQKHNVDSCIKKFAFDEAKKFYYDGRSNEQLRKCDFSEFDAKIFMMNDYRVVNVYSNGTAQLIKPTNSEHVIIDGDYKFVTAEVTEIAINNEFYSGRFTGQLVDGKPNGKGRIDGTNNVGVKFYYDGELKNGLANGFGKVTLPSGDTYEGQWLDGYRNGAGTYTWVTRFNGMVFKGEWANDKVTKGNFYNSDGTPNTEYTISVR